MLQTAYLYLRSSGAYFDLALKTTWDVKKKSTLCKCTVHLEGACFHFPILEDAISPKKEEDDN